MNITDTKVTVFDAEDKGKYVQANLSEGRKNQDGTWTNMSWRTRFVGKCKDRASGLQDKDKITITNGIVTNEYNKEQKRVYVNVVVFEFEGGSEDKGFMDIPDTDDIGLLF